MDEHERKIQAYIDEVGAERSYREHVEAAREIAGRTYVEDLRRIQRRGLVEEEEM